MGETNENKYARYLQLAISCLRELNTDFAGTPTTVLLNVQTTDTVNLPSDFVNYMRIGGVDSGGNIIPLGYNANISLQQAFNSCGVPQPNTTHTGNSSFSVVGLDQVGLGSFNGWEQRADSWRNGELVGRMFGIGGGNAPNGSYRVDKEHGVIVLQGVRVSQIIMEYLSDLKLVNGNFMVDPFLVETVKCYIAWKGHARNLRISLGEKQQLRTEYFNEYRRSLMRFNSYSASEWLQALRQGNKMAPKF